MENPIRTGDYVEVSFEEISQKYIIYSIDMSNGDVYISNNLDSEEFSKLSQTETGYRVWETDIE